MERSTSFNDFPRSQMIFPYVPMKKSMGFGCQETIAEVALSTKARVWRSQYFWATPRQLVSWKNTFFWGGKPWKITSFNMNIIYIYNIIYI